VTLAGIVEARGVRATSEGLAYRDTFTSTRRDTLPGSGTIPWDPVLGVDAQGNKARQGAIGTGATVGTIGLLIGFAGGVASQGGVGSWVFEGVALGAAGGALLGAAMGSMMRTWVRVYPPPSRKGAAPQLMATDLDSTNSAQLRLIAIAPFANFSKRKRAEEGQRIREAIYRELTRLSDSRAVIQPLAETDRKILEASHAASAAFRLPAAEICKLLGTDAVMMGAITRAKGRDVEADIAIYEGASGKLVWRQNVRKSKVFGGPYHLLATAVGTMVAETFPYRRSTAHR
jgi:hypothetical protein